MTIPLSKSWKTIEKIEDLKTGDVVRHQVETESLVVTAVYGDRATAVRTTDLTNASEWLVLKDQKD